MKRIIRSIAMWIRFQRVCAWHRPHPKRIGGNPLASRITHGICVECSKKLLHPEDLPL